MSVPIPHHTFSEISNSVLSANNIFITTADLVTSFPILAPNGLVSAPSYSFASNLNSGLFWNSSGVGLCVDSDLSLLAAANGNVALGSIPTNFAGGKQVLFLSDASVNPVGAPGSAGGLLFVDGSSLQYINNTGVSTDITVPALGTVNGPLASVNSDIVIYSNTTGFNIADSGIRFLSNQIRAGSGSPSFPSYSFSSESSGMYLASASTLGFIVQTTNVLNCSSTGTTCLVPVTSVNGSESLPSITFTSDPSSGLFSVSSHLGFSVGGVAGLMCGAHNVSWTSANTSGYGTNASGVMWFPNATTAPVGIPNAGNGGILYSTAAATELRFLNSVGTSYLVGGDLAGVGTVEDAQVLVWSNVSGTAVAARTVISDAGVISAVQDSPVATYPAYSFSGDTTTGLGLLSPGILGLIIGGSTVLQLTASLFTSGVPTLFVETSSTVAPGLSFKSDSTIGFHAFQDGTFPENAIRSVQGGFGFSESSNVTFCNRETNDYGGGLGVVRIGKTSSPPVAGPASGGYLYVDNNDLYFLDSSSTTKLLTPGSKVQGPVTSTVDAVVRFDGVSGDVVQDSGVLISSNQMSVVNTSGYGFVGAATTGIFSASAGSFHFDSAGTAAVTVSATSVTASQRVKQVNGSSSSPSYSFTSSTSSGLYRRSSGQASISANGVPSLTFQATNNVAFGSTSPDFAGGEGVIFLSPASVFPAGSLASGGLLYINTRNLYFHGAGGIATLLSGISLLGTSTDNALVRYNGTLGRTVQDTANFTYVSNQLKAPDGTVGAPSYTVGGVSSTTGWSLSGTTVNLGEGAAQLAVTLTEVTASVAFSALNGIQIGGTLGVTQSFSSPLLTNSINDSSGIFRWNRNGTTIMESTTNRDLDIKSNSFLFSGGTGNLELTFNSTWRLDALNAADSIKVAVAGTDIITVDSTGATFSNLEVNTTAGSNTGFFFTAATTSGLSTGNGQILVNNVVAMGPGTSSISTILNGSGGTGTSTITWPAVTVAPTNPSSGAYLYVDPSGEFFVITNPTKTVTVNGPNAFAIWTRTQTISNDSDTLVDTLVSSSANILVIDTGSPGAGTVTGTANTGGWWQVIANASFASDSTGYRQVRILIDAVEVCNVKQNAVNGTTTDLNVTSNVNVGASSVMTVRVYQNSGGNLSATMRASAMFLG